MIDSTPHSGLSPSNLGRRRMLHGAGAAALLATLGRQAMAQVPELARIVTGFAAGGTSDAICRRVATQLAPGYARTAMVENRTGAGGQIAIQFVKSQPADGSTILQTPSSMLTIYPHIYRKLPYDVATDLTPVTVGCVFDFGFAVGPAVPLSVRTMPEFFAWAKTRPDGANFGSPAAGSTPHFIGAMLGKINGVDMRHIAYRGTQPAMLDLLGGNLASVSGPIGDIVQHVPTGKVRMLGVSGADRSRFSPDTPTYKEQGYPQVVAQEWFVFMLPAKADARIVDGLNAALRRALASPEVVESLATFGLEAMSSTPAELAALLREDTRRWAPIVKDVGFTAEP